MAKARISKFGLVLSLVTLILTAGLMYLLLAPTGQQSVLQADKNSRIYDSSVGGDGTIYLISCNSPYAVFDTNTSISALASDGSLKWKRPLSEFYCAGSNGSDSYVAEIMGADEDSVYVLIHDCDATAGNPCPYDYSHVLAAVSSAGQLKWIFPLSDHRPTISGTGSKADCIADRIYLNANITEYVLDKQGNVLAKVDLAPGVAVGPDGNFYVRKAASAHIEVTPDGGISAGWAHSKVFQAYSPDGDLLWERNLSEYPVAFLDYTGMPILHNGILYVILEDGVIALGTDGKTMWAWQTENQVSSTPYGMMLYGEMPFDAEGNIYLYTPSISGGWSYSYKVYDFYVISPEGKLVRTYTETEDHSKNVLARDGQIVYYTPDIPADAGRAAIPETKKSLDDLDTVTIKAYDSARKEDLWSVRLPSGNVTTVTVTPNNVGQLFPVSISVDIERMNRDNRGDNPGAPYYDVFNKTPDSILSLKEAKASASDDIVYVNLYTYGYENPTEYNKSRCAYASTLYAIGTNGTVLWQKSVTGNIYWMAAGNNSTIYYSTTDGRVFTAAMAVTGGITAAAILYAVAHFFGAGTVTRARGRLDANENRNSVLGYIAASPGSTMRDVARGLDMNLGTIRYHLLILGLNHRIASYQADGKHMRYFVNSGAYTAEEQRIIAAVRREGMRNVIESLLRQPGQSNKGLSSTVGMRESAISRYVGELVSAGLAEKTTTPDGCNRYSIKDSARASVESALGLVPGKVVPEETGLNSSRTPEE